MKKVYSFKPIKEWGFFYGLLRLQKASTSLALLPVPFLKRPIVALLIYLFQVFLAALKRRGQSR